MTGLPADVDTTKATISFTMPANKVTLKAQYTENAPKTYKLDVSDATVTLKDGSAVADLKAVPVGTELVATAAEKDGYTFTGWEVTGLPTDVDTTKATISFTMPANKVTLKAQYTENAPETYELKVTNAKVTLKDGGDVADLTAVPVGTELVATAPEKDGYTFTGWEKEGLPADVDTTKATISFKMPANKVTLTPQYEKNTYTLTLDGVDEQHVAGDDINFIASDKEGYTFSYWKAEGVPEGTDTTKANIRFTMPANNVTLEAQYKQNTYTLTVDGVDEPRVFDENVMVTAPEKEGYTFTGWEKEGLPADAKIDGANITFKMPANNVTLKAQYTENAPKTYKLDVSGATVTLKDGSAVADLKAVPVGTELKATADEDTETSVFKNWSCTGLELTEEQSTARVLEFTMPDHDVDLMAAFDTLTKPDPDPTPAPGGDSDGGGAIVMVAAVGSAAIGAGAYIVGTTAYLKSVLPEGMAIPANRQQLAVALWTAAGKPATQSTALFNDVAADAAELQAIRWVVDTGLMSAQDGSFKPGSRVGRMEVIRTWKTYQQRG